MNASRLPLLPALSSLALSAITLGWVPAVRAELPPWVYGQEQRQAPYVLELLVRSVHTTAAGAEPEQLRVQAQVLEVKRQPPAARLRAGDAITLSYPLPPSRPSGWAGPAPLPVLQVGERLPAWLAPDPSLQGVFQPAAGGRSFGPAMESEREPG
jgi:hypothetical protein